MFLNSVISDTHKDTRYVTADINSHYLNNTIENLQYMKLTVRFLNDEIREEYEIRNLAHIEFVHVKIRKGMHSLKKSGIIAFKRLVKNLAPHGYHPMKHTPGVWMHTTRKIIFTFTVNNFELNIQI